MRTVLNQSQPVLLADLCKPIQLHGLPRIVYGNHGLRPLSDSRFHSLWVDIIRFRINIGKYRSCTTVQGTVRRCCESDRRGNHFISLSDTCCHRRHMESRRTIAADHRIPRAGQPAQFIFQLIDLRPAGQIITFQDFHHGFNIGIVYILMSIVYFRFSDGCTALYCRFVHNSFLSLTLLCMPTVKWHNRRFIVEKDMHSYMHVPLSQLPACPQ